MKVGFGCDHTAIDLKKELMEYMTQKGYECVDYGAYDAKVRVDYPDQGQKVAEAIIAGEVEKGVLICGTGIGISLAANKVPIHSSEQQNQRLKKSKTVPSQSSDWLLPNYPVHRQLPVFLIPHTLLHPG